MTSRRQQLLTRMLKSVSGETEEKLLKLTVERIIADQADYYRKLYELYYPNTSNNIPYFWMPNFIDATDASARTLPLYSNA